ncbi:hypothetical protein Pmani_003897 [Petrolisthes manimaculis]|uniref:Uncharacterized protein n=1 Tax=Petrolisthes manimaculis TaxID=1843537 RepID=A0AAE1UNW1_9EUCA|nr:hypothetical protein Pmani_003897 [Petrolisthes manimaculis]
MSLVTGFVLGGGIGLFAANVTPTIPTADKPQQSALEGKNLAAIGFMFSGVECTIESKKLEAELQQLKKSLRPKSVSLWRREITSRVS